AVRERVAVEQVPHLARVARQPGEWIARDRGIEQTLEATALRFDEGVVKVARDPGMLVKPPPLERDDVHDGPDIGLRGVCLLHLQIVRKQAHYVRMAL